MLSKHLREIRLEHNLTQKNIADVLGIDRTTYTYYENGVTSPSPETLYKLSKIYHVTVGYLMGVEKNPLGVSGGESRIMLSSGAIDPLSELGKEEKTLLMCYRVLNAQDKEKAMALLLELARATDDD